MNIPTQRQLSFVQKLAAERDVNLTLWLTTANRQQVSAKIDELLRTPKPRAVTEAPQAEPADAGYYLHGDDVVVVTKARQSDRRYAKTLKFNVADDGSHRPFWDYTPGLVWHLSAADMLTVEQASTLGHLHGHCVVCVRALTDPQSVEAGIGPVCARKLRRQAEQAAVAVEAVTA